MQDIARDALIRKWNPSGVKRSNLAEKGYKAHGRLVLGYDHRWLRACVPNRVGFTRFDGDLVALNERTPSATPNEQPKATRHDDKPLLLVGMDVEWAPDGIGR
ncbi:MAG: hypothetical protein AAF730_10760 [Bacteroidota bacterium]